ncbi:MAG TPA: BamA/TamA family outer membrane protein [Zeimonas sp.]
MRAGPATRLAHRVRLPALRRLLELLVTMVVLGPFGVPADARAANYELKVDALGELVEPIRNRTLVGRWIDDPGFDPEQMPLFLERAKIEAEAIAQAAGFFSARADVTYEPGAAQGPPVVRIVVDAGARTTVNRFDFVLDGPAPVQKLRARLLERWPLPEGTFFRSAPWQSGKRLLIDALQQRGYVRARIVDSEARVDPENTTAALAVHVDSGPRLDFGPITIEGLARYDASIVRALAPWEDEGSRPYDFDEVLAFQARLRTSGYFDSAEVLPDFAAVLADPQRTTVPLRVAVSERRAQRVTVGVGVSSDEGARALLGYEHRNVFGKGWQLESGVLLQSVRRRVFASLRTPQKASGHYYQGGVRLERFDVQGERTDKQTAFLGEGKRSDDADRFLSLQYQTEQRNVRGIGDVESTRALTLAYAWSTRRLDSTLDPRRGYAISAQLSGASQALLSDRSFVRLHTRATRFWPMPADSVLDGGILVGLAEFGQVFAAGRDGIPSENLFRAGGTSTIRGYDFLSLGVREGRAVVGGRVLALGSLEYQHPVRRDWYAAAFVDVGDAADTWGRYDPVAGYGVGARWRSPVGPVSVDLAYGEAVRDWRVHFSVGYAF